MIVSAKKSRRGRNYRFPWSEGGYLSFFGGVDIRCVLHFDMCVERTAGSAKKLGSND